MVDYSKEILSKLGYSGNKEASKKNISASMISGEPQQAFMRYKYGVEPEDSFSQASFGSLVHLGLEQVFKDKKNILCEEALSYEFEGWNISGTIDRLDLSNNVITDIKTTKTYSIANVKKDMNHQYRWQLNTYRWLVHKVTDRDCSMQLEFYDKQGGMDFRKGIEVPTLSYLDIDLIADELIEEKIREIILYIENGVENQCKELWFRKVNGVNIPMRCEAYCSYKGKCTQYSPKDTTTMSMW